MVKTKYYWLQKALSLRLLYFLLKRKRQEMKLFLGVVKGIDRCLKLALFQHFYCMVHLKSSLPTESCRQGPLWEPWLLISVKGCSTFKVSVPPEKNLSPPPSTTQLFPPHCLDQAGHCRPFLNVRACLLLLLLWLLPSSNPVSTQQPELSLKYANQIM